MPRAARQRDGQNAFVRMLDFLPDAGVAAVLEAYFDESERSGGTFCVAGYAFAKQQAKKFAKEWSRLFGGFKGGLHTVDLVHRKKAFENLSIEEANKLLVRAVDIINRRMTVGVAISCKLADVEAFSPKWIRGFGHAYPLCCHLAAVSLGSYLEETKHAENVAYFFESGHAHEREAREFIKNASLLPAVKYLYRHHSDSFLPKTDAIALQSADLLAWEWAKFADETLETPVRQIRRSLRALIRAAPGRYRVHTLSREKVARFMKQVAQLGLIQLSEQLPWQEDF